MENMDENLNQKSDNNLTSSSSSCSSDASSVLIECGNDQNSPRKRNQKPKVRKNDQPKTVSDEIENKSKYNCVKKLSSESIAEPSYCLYIASYQTDALIPKVELSIKTLKNAIKGAVTGRYKLTRTKSGILATFSKDRDTEKIIKMNMARIFGGPVQIANLSSYSKSYKKAVVFNDIPWCISDSEIGRCLEKQRIHYGQISRFKQYIRVEILDSSDVERLLQEGLNFHDSVAFIGTLETNRTENHSNDIVQCYKCQGFWHTANHCKHAVRCVRCGDHHDVEFCQRSKNNPICCNCQGPHHAAYKLCPTKLRLMNSVNVAISYSRQK